MSKDLQEIAAMQISLSTEAVKAFQRLEARIKVLEEEFSRTHRGEVSTTHKTRRSGQAQQPQEGLSDES